jgi:hypothetical protein
MIMRALLLGVTISLLAGAAWAEQVSLCALARDPDAYDGQTVTVIATYDPGIGDNGAFQDSECGGAVVLANLAAQPSPSAAFETAAAPGLPLLVTATGVFHNFPGDTPTLQIDVETIAPE